MALALLFAAAAGALALQAPAAPMPTADPCAGDPSCIRTSAGQLFEAADELARAGQVGEAEDLLVAVTNDRNPAYRAEARFRLAVLREAAGDLPGAIAWLRALLAEQPAAPRARLELSRLLAAQGKAREARRELQRAQEAGLPADVARTVGRFSSLLAATRRRGGSIDLAAGLDSNVNRSTSDQFIQTVIAPFELDADARRQAGPAIAAAVQAYSRDQVGRLTLLTRGGVRGDFFPGKSRFNDLQLYAGTGPEFASRSGRIRPALAVERRWFGGRSYSSGFGGALSWIAPLSPASQVELDASVVRQSVRDNAVLDGTRYAVSAIYDRALGRDVSVRFSLRGALLEAALKPESLRQGAGELILARDLDFGNVYGSLGYAKTRGRAELQLFGATRDDDRIDLGAGIVARRTWLGFAPLARLSYTRSWSNIALYDYRRGRVELGLTRDF